MLQKGLFWCALIFGVGAVEMPKYTNETVQEALDYGAPVQRTPEHTCKEYAIEYCKQHPYVTTKTETCYVTIRPSPSTVTVT